MNGMNLGVLSVLMSIFRRILLGLAFSFVISSSYASPEKQTGRSNGQYSEQDFNLFLSGKPVTSKKNLEFEKVNTTSLSTENISIANLNKALNSLIKAIKQTTGRSSTGFLSNIQASYALNTSDFGSLKGKYESFKALHLLHLNRFDRHQNKLQENGYSAKFTTKIVTEKQQYLDLINPLIEVMDHIFLEADEKSGFGLVDSYNIYTLLSELDNLTQFMEMENDQILRAQLLPVRSLSLAAREPALTNFVTPSYLLDYQQPSSANDISENGEIIFSKLIRETAETLDHDPIKIYEFVRNEIKTEIYAGAMKGPDNTLVQKSGNDVDQSSLLIALLRASGIPAKYVQGVIEQDISQFAVQFGLSDPKEIAKALRESNISSKAIVRGGRIAAFQLESTWVSSLIPYANYRGAVVDKSGLTWIALMPSIKKMQIEASAGLLLESDFSSDTFIESYLAEIQESSPLNFIQNLLKEGLLAKGDLRAYESFLGSETIVKQYGDYVPNSLPAKVLGVTSESSLLDEHARHWVTFKVYANNSVSGPVILEEKVALSRLDNQRITLSYLPGDRESQNIINSYGGLSNVPAYLINLRPQLRVNGKSLSTGKQALGMGEKHLLALQVTGPGYSETVTKTLTSGGYHAVAISAQDVKNMGDDQKKEGDEEFLAARALSQIALRYSQAWDEANNELSLLTKTKIIQPIPSIVFASNEINVEKVFGRPNDLNWMGVTLDAALRINSIVKTHSSALDEVEWRKLSSLQGSYLEHAIFEDLFSVESISADKLLAHAVSAGVITYKTDATNWDVISPSLQHPQNIIDEIQSWVASGYTVRTLQAPMNLNAWSGSAWIVTNEATGASGYFLSGGLAGGSSTIYPTEWPFVIAEALTRPYIGIPNIDAQAGAAAYVIPATNGQMGPAGSVVRHPLQLVVVDELGNRVSGAIVTFKVIKGQANLGVNGAADTDQLVTEYETETDSSGFATALFTYPKTFYDSSNFTKLNADDEVFSRIGVVLIDAEVKTKNGVIRPLQPFGAFALPDLPVHVARIIPHDITIGDIDGENWIFKGGEPIKPYVLGDILSDYLPDHPNFDTNDGRGRYSTFVAVIDKFGNMISNISLIATVIQPSVYESKTLLMGQKELADCRSKGISNLFSRKCGLEKINMLSESLTGHIFATLQGQLETANERYIVKIDGFLNNALTPFDSLLLDYGSKNIEDYYIETVFNGTYEGVQNAVKMGEEYKGKLEFSVNWDEQFTMEEGYPIISASPTDLDIKDLPAYKPLSEEPLSEETIALVPPALTSLNVIGTTNSSIEYEMGIFGANFPVLNYAHIESIYLDESGKPVKRSGPLSGMSVATVDLALDKKSLEAFSIEGGDISFSFDAPSTYHPSLATVRIKKEGTVFLEVPADLTGQEWRYGPPTDTVPGRLLTRGVAKIPRGVFDKENQYSAVVYLNPGNPKTEVKSPEEAITFAGPLIDKVFGSIDAMSEPPNESLIKYSANEIRGQIYIDLANQTQCTGAGRLRFDVKKASKVTLTFYKGENKKSSTDTIVVFEDKEFRPGTETFAFKESAISLGVLKQGHYYFELKAEEILPLNSKKDPQVDIVPGRAYIRNVYSDTLPLAHANYENIDLFDGHLFLSRNDISLPGRGKPISFTRSYSSSTARLGSMGVGWSHNYDSKIMITGCGGTTLVGGDGGGQTFTVDETTGEYIPQKGYHGTLKFVVSGYDFYSKDGTKYHYVDYNFGQHNEYYLASITDTNGNVTKITYDASAAHQPKIESVENGEHKLQFVYENRSTIDGTGPVVSKIYACVPKSNCNEGEPPGANKLFEVVYEYDLYGRLRTATYYGDSSKPQNKRSESYDYKVLDEDIYKDGYIERATISTITDAENNTTRYTSDTHKMFSSTDITGEPTRIPVYIGVQRPEGGNVVFSYPGLRHTRPSVLTTVVTDPRENITTYELNGYGAPLKIVSPAGTKKMEWELTNDVQLKSSTDENQVTTVFEYDVHGNKTAEFIKTNEFEVAGTRKKWDYHPQAGGTIKNLLREYTNTRGHKTTYEYDGSGNLLLVTYPKPTLSSRWKESESTALTESFTYDQKNGDRLTSTDKNGNVTIYGYDDFGNVEKVINPLAHTSYTLWNSFGLKVAESDERSAKKLDPVYRTLYDYNGLNQLVKITYPKTNEGIATRKFTNDLNGNRLSETDEEENTSNWEYDDENRIETETNALRKTRTFSYDPAGNLETETQFRKDTLTTYTYDSANRQKTVEGPEDRILNRTFDDAGNIEKEYVTPNKMLTYGYDEYNRRITVVDPYNKTAYKKYDGEGNLISETDPRGEEDGVSTEITYVYDELNRLTDKIEPLGRTTSYVYDGNGNVLYHIDPNGGITKNTYDELNRLTAVLDAEQYSGLSTITSVQKTPAQAFEYDPVGNLLQETNRRGFIATYSYDARNRRTTATITGTVDGQEQDITTEYGYYKTGKLKTEKLPNQDTIEYTYDALNRLKTITDGLGLREENFYDDDGNIEQKRDANGNLTIFTYDNLNRLKSTTLPGKRSTSITYDVYGNVKTRTDAKNKTTTYRYDLLNRLEEVEDPAPFSEQISKMRYDAAGNKTEDEDRRGNITRYDYDARSLLRKTTYPLDTVSGEQYTESWEYDANNNVKIAIDKRGISTESFYDFNNRVKQQKRDNIILFTRLYDGEGNVIIETDAEHNTTSFDYDGRNLLIAENRPQAAVTRFEYDFMGNQNTVIDPEGVTTQSEYDVRNRMMWSETPNQDSAGADRTVFTYNGNGKLRTKTLPKGQQWQYIYDLSDRLTFVIAPGGVTTGYDYDDNDNLETLTDAENNVTTYFYDELNRKTQVTFPDNAVVTYDNYDANGNLKSMTDANGQGITFIYDVLNRETKRSYAGVNASLSNNITSVATSYDGNNNVNTVTETYSEIGERVYSWVYDKFDRNKTYTDAFGKTLAYQYDNNGNRKLLTDPDNTVTKYEYDDLNRLRAVINNKGTTQYTYYRDSKLKRVLYPNNIAADYRYHPNGRLKSIANTQNNASVSKYVYLYDDNGNRIQQYEENGAGPEFTRYGFDDLDRLKTVAYTIPDCVSQALAEDALCETYSAGQLNVTYGYDDAYNRTSEIHADYDGKLVMDRTYVPNARNQIDQILDNLDASQNIDYQYDDNGNQTQKSQAGTTTAFVWDTRNNLRKIMVGGSTVGQFLYDSQKLRIEKIGDRGTERYTYDDQSVLIQTDASGNTLAKYDYGPDRLLSLTHTREGTQYYLTDALNSVVNLAKPDGSIQARYQYDAFGNKRGQVGNSWNRFSFTGYEEDTESGLLYAKARFYDPDIGRFLSHDAWEGDQTLPPSLHKYLYAYQNPTVWWDPTGNVAYKWQDEDGQWHFSDKAPNGTLGKVGDGLTDDQRVVKERINKQLDNRNLGACDPNVSGDCDGAMEADPDSVAEIYGRNVSVTFNKESETSNEVDEVEDYKLRVVKPVLKQISRFDDLAQVAGCLHAACSAYEVGRWAKNASVEDLKGALRAVKDHPEKAALASALILYCKGRCGGYSSKLVGGPGVSTKRYKYLRANSPSDDIRKMVNYKGRSPRDKYKDPALGILDDKLEADHTVSLKAITKIPGFELLTKQQQLDIANYRRNFIGLVKSANASKGAKEWMSWSEHKRAGVEVSKSFKKKMIRKERKLLYEIRQKINEALGENGTL